uniref:Uncharacterized protein n=1 Tax=Corethron hystrix TaxID=216773 RepID=A0A7S1BAG3_9STRA|mmetsp:Transcript_19396/g.44187  ORF Transcript_19396/g.44187 Transcript_19396/m.44187 type:complete len:235 (+) Transcript_19396:82-786(+)|eukprot:CAMPEP_0113297014 /NCGR_PEP_ID=MMETSP0010_2-20120614/54_1 /TAXON_ID=216773 ORGANISM="Corethron hystrix, Strain 308" /NCGR_SAMPLE_ID=MMETSP0010_2 /ASSEMBLY_ACC=CAM_ASM_000155 /LENGTH=234 /DNA_ID=CAMNT_0000149835 /DNA_START=42 /DNA_END=746 /DNA_ORIENTATION=- /assembly_acc=CAM_ASM_000155
MVSVNLGIICFIFASVANAQYDEYDSPDMPKPPVCPDFQCGDDLELVPQLPIKLTSPGCDHNSSLRLTKKDSKEDPEVTLCCDRKHACYQTCGSDKAVCDATFNKCNLDYCSSLSTSKQIKCKASAKNSNIMVQFGHCSSFTNLQKENCECVPKEKAQDVRDQAIAAFYDEYAGDQQSQTEKVKKLMAKTTTSKNLANLFSMLVEKYPSAVKEVEDEQALMMERMRDGMKGTSK